MTEELTKKIYYYNLGIHTYVQHTIQHPPRGYQFIATDDLQRKQLVSSLRKNPLLVFIYKRIFKRLFNVLPLLNRVYYKPSPPETDLVISNGTLVDEQKPWILETLDAPQSLGGNDYRIFLKNIPRIENALLSHYCKRILVHTDACKKEFEKYFSSNVIEKILKVTPGISGSDEIRRPVRRRTLTFLFMGSINNPSEFYIKGGLEAFATFQKLVVQYPYARLVVKCFVPPEIKEQYKDVPHIEIIDRNLSDSEMEKLYLDSDVLLMPGHGYYVMAFLEAFSYGLPIISLDTYGVSEFVKDKINGFVIRPSMQIPYSDPEYPVNVRSEKFIA